VHPAVLLVGEHALTLPPEAGVVLGLRDAQVVLVPAQVGSDELLAKGKQQPAHLEPQQRAEQAVRPGCCWCRRRRHRHHRHDSSQSHHPPPAPSSSSFVLDLMRSDDPMPFICYLGAMSIACYK